MEDLVMVGDVAIRPSDVIFVKPHNYIGGASIVRVRDHNSRGGIEVMVRDLDPRLVAHIINNRGGKVNVS